MKEFLFSAGVLCWLAALAIFMMAPTAIQEGVSGLVGVSGSVLFVGGAIVGAIQKLPQAALIESAPRR